MIKAVFAYSPITVDGVNKLAFGFKNELPWGRVKEDLQLFKKSTEGSVVVMGTNTWVSLPKALPNRTSVMLGKCMEPNQSGEMPDVLMKGDLYQALNEIKTHYPDRDICFIGGAGIILESLDFVDEVVMTKIVLDRDIEADVFLSPMIAPALYVDFEKKGETGWIQFEGGKLNQITYVRK